MAKIFISYRRDDAKYPADRLHSALKKYVRNPKSNIFIDIDGIPAGVNFAQYLDEKVSQCEVLLALIGPDWIHAVNPNTGKRRLDDPTDFVRIEIASALKRNILVAPILLDGASMPSKDELPDDLKALVLQNGVEVRRDTFNYDVERLMRKLDLRRLKAARGITWVASRSGPANQASTTGRHSAAVLAGAVFLIAALGAGWGYTQGWFGTQAANPADTAAATPAESKLLPAAASNDEGEATAWRAAERAQTAEAYSSYLDAYETGAHAAEAKAALERIFDDADWATVSVGDRAALRAYLSAHPSGAYVDEAKSALAQLDEKERQAALAKTEDDRKELARKATERRDDELKEAERQADERAWSIAKSADTVSAFSAYIEQYPNGINAHIARAGIDRLSAQIGVSSSASQSEGASESSAKTCRTVQKVLPRRSIEPRR